MFATKHRRPVLHPKLNHPMKRLIATFALAFAAFAATAQELIPQEDLEKGVPRALARVADFDNLPLKTDVDGAKAFGMKAKQYAAVVIPEKGLTKESLAKAGKEVVPVGQLWLVKLSPVVKDATTTNDKLCMVTISVKDEDLRLCLLLLGARKSGETGLELVIYAKAKEPLLTLPLKKSDTKQALPLEIGVREGTSSLGLVDINILSEYQAALSVGEQE